MKEKLKNGGQKLWLILRGWAVLWSVLQLGQWVAEMLPLGVPGSIWGLLLMFLGLQFNLVPLPWVQDGAGLLIRFMAVLFVPVSVGIIDYADLMWSKLTVFLLPNILSTLLGLVCIGLLADRLFTLYAAAHKRRKAQARTVIQGGLK